MEQALMKLALAFMGGAGHYFMFETMQRMRQNRDSSISHQDNDSSFSLMFLGMAASIEHNYKKAAENFIKLKLDSKQWQINYIIGIGLSKACWDDLHDTLKIDYQEKAINAFTIALEDESLDEDKRAELYIRRAESRMVYVCAAQKLNLAIDVNP